MHARPHNILEALGYPCSGNWDPSSPLPIVPDVLYYLPVADKFLRDSAY